MIYMEHAFKMRKLINNMEIKLRTMKKEIGKIDTQIDYLINDLNKLTVSEETLNRGLD